MVGPDQIDRLGDYRLLIMADALCCDDTVAEAVASFVAKGNAVLATHRSGLYDRSGRRRARSTLTDLLGVEIGASSPYSVSYFDVTDPALANGLPDMPLLVKLDGDRTLHIQPGPDTAVLAGLADPAMEARPHRHVYHQHAHPARKGRPGVSSHAVGRGRAVYVAAPIEAAFEGSGSPWLRRLYGNLIRLLLPDPTLCVEASPTVLLASSWLGSDLVVHLIAVPPGSADGSPQFADHPVHAGTATITVRGGWHRAVLVPSQEVLSVTVVDGGSRCEVAIEGHVMIKFESSAAVR